MPRSRWSFRSDFDRAVEDFAASYFDAVRIRQHLELITVSQNCILVCRANVLQFLAESGAYEELSLGAKKKVATEIKPNKNNVLVT